MTLVEVSLLAGLVTAICGGVFSMLVLIWRISSVKTKFEEDIAHLKYQQNNDILGRSAVAAVKEDITAIKVKMAVIPSIQDDINKIHHRIDDFLTTITQHNHRGIHHG